MSFRFDDQQRQDARNAVLCWLASCDTEGHPNASPKEIWTLSDQGAS